MAGTFITFEGGEGAGKSTQIERLRRFLEAEGHDVVVTREPGGSPRAEEIRAFILGGRAKDRGPVLETILFAAARLDHLDTTIRPALAAEKVVLSDRFADSTRAYQGASGGIESGLIEAIERVTLDDTRPDLTFILDLPPETGLARADKRRAGTGGPADRFEGEALAFHASLREAFRSIAEREPGRCVLIDADRDADTVEAAIRTALLARLPHLAAPKDLRDAS
ncbi:dTMP kinase [Microvirga pudoricolor]|uniref:dTMP kinase n=1 Tax=Microvirga pudoricolor TaxID=2778729 RepID=UPI0019511ADC|nr:dTMP kinase [Microvirga pudoricolor]MBM6595706.1 dTMP kinase [Microvirga pudoricolor]